MSVRNKLSFTAFGWTMGARFSPRWLMFEVAWETSPPSLVLPLPPVRFWVERVETNYGIDRWQWGWSLLRLTIWKTEFRLDLDLNIWAVGLTCVELDDFGIYLGP